MNTERLRSLAKMHLAIGDNEGWSQEDATREFIALALEAAALLEQPAPTPAASAPQAEWEREFPPEWDRHPWANYANLQASFSHFDGITFTWIYWQHEPQWGERSYNWVDGLHGFANPVTRAPLSTFFDTRATLRKRPAGGQEG